MREIGGNPNFIPPNSPICILGKRICSKMGVSFTAIWVNQGYTAKREMSEEIRVSPMIFLTGNAVGVGVRVRPKGLGVDLAFSHGVPFNK